MESYAYALSPCKQSTYVRQQCQDHFTDKWANSRNQCRKCHALNQILICTQRKYLQLKSQNQAGELTIWHLKQKNKKLLQKISKNQDRRQHSRKDKLRQQNQNIAPNYIKQEMLQTFNPLQLSKMIRQNSEKFSQGEKNQPITKQNSFIQSTKINSSIKQSESRVKKPFKLQQLKRRAQQRLNLNRDISLKKKSSKKQNQRRNRQSQQQFKFY